ncbi:pentatricopeptide repeat-containing protein At4g08210 [Dendrobium catenatum]|uniref:Pentatricopeptide repeat-containing protein n=1 Tax=Dendrobium catenatum TaxID=906689 RepID=A0A2I0VU74_9ASPA|nr:pentatricopeptide repeat-containing protein At4g08210 [Dendrobium catenatum]PKU66944.1 Pentatricopeptide repeat-containing protein [Dendrobium catenatum]
MQARLWRSIFGFSRFQIINTRASNFSTDHSFGFPSRSFLDSEAITRALIWCRQTQTLGNGEALHSRMIRLGLYRYVYLSNNLISMYAGFNLYDDAAKLFDEMPQRNVVTWTALISSYSLAGNPAEALKMFVEMLDGRLEEPNCYTFSVALKACAKLGDLDMGKWVHKQIQKFQLQFDTALINAVIDMYVKCGSLVEARKIFDMKISLNSASWNTMICGYCNVGEMIEAENLFCEISMPDAVSFNTLIMGFASMENPKALHYVTLMHKHGFKLDCFTLPCALKACGSISESGMGKQLHSYIIRCGLCMVSSLINMYGNCGHVDAAVKLFDECSNYNLSLVDRLSHLNSMLSAYANNGYDSCVLYLLSKIHSSEVELDTLSLSSALKACINLNIIRVGLQVHGLIIIKGYHVDHVVGSILVDLYAKCGQLEDAVKIFFGLHRKDLVAWTGLITSCVQKGMNEFALAVFRDMISIQCEVDHFVVSIILKACAALSWLQSGEQLHVLCIKGGFEMESVIVTSLIDVYSKCGHIEYALRLFEASTKKDIVCWTGIIVGCGNNGRTDEAFQLFNLMLESGEQPNEITFLGVLSACRHAGLVSHANSIFKAMEQKHGLKPFLEHYCCMIDIYCRAGLFDEAMQLISGMPYEPDEKIWNSMLGASVMHQNVSMGRFSLSNLQKFSRKDASGFVSLSNVYAGHDLWGRSAEMREVARSLSLKEPGRSWTQARN